MTLEKPFHKGNELTLVESTDVFKSIYKARNSSTGKREIFFNALFHESYVNHHVSEAVKHHSC